MALQRHIAALAGALGVNITRSEMVILLEKHIDLHGKGYIDFHAFFNWWARGPPSVLLGAPSTHTHTRARTHTHMHACIPSRRQSALDYSALHSVCVLRNPA